MQDLTPFSLTPFSLTPFSFLLFLLFCAFFGRYVESHLLGALTPVSPVRSMDRWVTLR